ncbi:MAG: tRNA (adenosine(37)-N6)-threonylcarbamoyltransferase complex dimerization subunit type 1 TsaB [Oscillospiraceae bacterium]|jgi:tRNA threonylcarbamoyladenosine biosynthesis protein TsaB|uniref:tRNA (adenosine(37)-N6)-threonylcarbamoyltransferase complex dimerization subunit type 1 TsaB n=1 Tax=Candidatus Limivicinus sp. TaxID=3030905 RepID=UPI002ECA9FA4|nr:tRNA (adenosine(37)-N6)-threonylcarbamoyltransferase complex dimerization subunit type 1 TsaB [Oscillospiraceae bacterium]
MLILAFESSAKPASAALVKDGQLLSQYMQCSALTHSRTLLPMAEDMLKNAELRLSDVDLIAVAHGPGSFTGIRIGVSTVKGLAWAAEKPCVGVSTLEAMAWHGLAVGGYICPVMDARRSQVYNALFKIENGRPVRMTEDRPIALEELAKEVTALGAPVFLIGDGAALCFEYFTAHGVPCVMAPDNLRWQDAWGVAMAAADKTPGNADELLPVYLRLSQAERERQERLSQSVNS